MSRSERAPLAVAIENAMGQAAKEKSLERLNPLRLIKKEIQAAEIEARAQGVTLDNTVIENILRKMSKRCLEAIKQFEEAGREELAQKERWDNQVICSFLPQLMSEEETEDIVKRLIRELSLHHPRDIKILIQKINEKYMGKIDTALAATMARKHLTL